jgi:HNH endonuclease
MYQIRNPKGSMGMARVRESLLDSRYYRTYAIAETLDRILKNRFSYVRFIGELFCDGQIFEYLPNFQKSSALHRFSKAVIWCMFYDDLDGPTLVPSSVQRNDGAPIWDKEVFVLPIEDAFETYEIEHQTFAEYRHDRGLTALPADFSRHIRHSSETGCDCDGLPGLEDEYLEYWQEMQLTGDVDCLLNRLSDDLFFVLFANRSFLAALNHLLASYVQDLVPPFEESQYNALFKGPGILARCKVPRWAQDAVEFRDRGRCSYCKVKLGSLHTPIRRSNFDHIIPLADGGLNDVTNFQLLCDECNLKKAANKVPPGHLYERWYPLY